MTPSVRVALVQTERCVAGHRPASGIVRHRCRAADLVETGEVQRNGLLRVAHTEMREIVRSTRGLTLATCAVIGQENEHRVLPLAGFLESFTQSTDALIDLVDHRRIHRHVPGVQRALVVAEIVPRSDLVAGFAVACW